MTSVHSTFNWTEEMEAAFVGLKQALTTPPVLAFPDFDEPFEVETDALTKAVGAVLSQKKEDGRVHPIQFASRTMNAAEKKYSACEREALVVVFALKKFRIYLRSSKSFVVITDQQALRGAFARRDIHGRLARWLDFLADYEFEIRYRSEISNKAADFLSRMTHGDRAISHDESEVMNLTMSDKPLHYAPTDLEDWLQYVIRHLSGQPSTKETGKEKAEIRRKSVKFVLWEGHLYRRGMNKLAVVVPRNERKKAIHHLHDTIGHWDVKATHYLIKDRFWWPGMPADVAHYVKTCHACQRMQTPERYRSNMFIPQSSLFDVYSIDFAGPFPETECGNRFLLVCVEHLTGWPIVLATKHSTAETVVNFLNKKIIPPFGPPGVVVSDNAACFKA